MTFDPQRPGLAQ